MKSVNKKLKVVVFCGGHGGKSIIEAMVKNPLFEMTAVVNCYDDGKSTGYLRRLIPGYLGPSDVRKNMSYFIDQNNLSKRILKDIIEYRFPRDLESKKGIQELHNIIQQKSLSLKDLDVYLKKLSYEDSVYIRVYIKQFLNYLKGNKIEFDFNDCSFGNILMTGAYIKNNFDFAKAISELHIAFSLMGKVRNVTRGENLFLSALTNDGEFLGSEASIVEKRAESQLNEIFLLERYLDKKEVKKIEKHSLEKKQKMLKDIEIYPLIDESVAEIIREADIMIYAPGTQNSSLFPTYLTKGFSEIILQNKKAKKIFVSNIGEDNEIPDATVDDIIDKAVYYLNRKNELSYKKEDFFDYYFVHYGNDIDPKYIKFLNRNNLQKVVHRNFEEGYSGRHDGNKIVEAILEIEQNGKPLGPGFRKLSIVIPAYNEAKSLPELLKRIDEVEFSSLGVAKEVIVVDNGSRDNTYELLKDNRSIKLFRIEKNIGKGDAVIKGIKEATGDVIVIQDADLEYNPQDIKEMLRVMMRHKFRAVYGSRTIKHETKVKSLSMLYGKKPEAYWSYYIGGQLLSFVTWLLYGEFITDTVTGYKMVDARLLKSFALKSKGFELDHEITAKVLKKKNKIYEIPISYIPRTVEEGKKIKWKDGLIAIKTLFKFRFVN